MARPPRTSYAGAIHHVMARSNDQRRLFTDDEDRLAFLEMMATVREMFEVEWQMFVLMNTHFHGKIRVPHDNLSAAMQHLLSKFAQWWNRRRARHGHLLDGRFKSPLIEDGFYARNVVRYIALNPVKDNYVAHAHEWRWSSHRGLAGLESPPEFIDVTWLRNLFDGRTLRECQLQYRRYIDDTEKEPVDHPDAVLNGSPEYAWDVRGIVGEEMHRVILPRSYRALGRPDLPELLADTIGDLERRNRMIVRAQVVHGYKQSEIARYLDLHPNTVSKITTAIRRRSHSLQRAS